MTNFKKIQELLSSACPFEPNEMTPEKNLVTDLELDSFGLMEMVIGFETEYDIEVPDIDLKKLVIVQDVIDYITEKAGVSKDEEFIPGV